MALIQMEFPSCHKLGSAEHVLAGALKVKLKLTYKTCLWCCRTRVSGHKLSLEWIGKEARHDCETCLEVLETLYPLRRSGTCGNWCFSGKEGFELFVSVTETLFGMERCIQVFHCQQWNLKEVSYLYQKRHQPPLSDIHHTMCTH